MKKQISMPIAFGKWYVTKIVEGIQWLMCTKCGRVWFDDNKVKRRVKCPACGNRVD